MKKIILMRDHILAADARMRRELMYQDVHTIAYTNGLVTSYDMYKRRMWDFVDNIKNQVDSIAWDAALFDRSALCPIEGVETIEKIPYDQFYREGHDIFQMLVEESHSRGIEALLACRIGGGENFRGLKDKLPLEHEDYYIKDWDFIPNLENLDVCERKTTIYKHVLEKYDFDGIVIDFCRHTPFLTPGLQWEKRDYVSEWMYNLRCMLNSLECKKGHPLFLGARVAPDVDGCKQDGLDLARWADNNLVDLLVLGDRCYTIDVSAFRQIMGTHVKLYPNLDAHHTTDGYFDPPIEVLNGTVHRWYCGGADGVSLFNWLTARESVYCETAGDNYKQQCVVEQFTDEPFLSIAGNKEEINKSNKTFVVERRGGYPWENGFANNNNQNQLPLILKNNGDTATVVVEVTEITEKITLSMMLYGMLDTDMLYVTLNGYSLALSRTHNVEDRQIFPLSEAPVSGYGQQKRIPSNRNTFDTYDCILDKNVMVLGKNILKMSVKRMMYPYLSKVELERVHISTYHANK